MSANTPEGRSGSSSAGQTGRFPAPRPRAQSTAAEDSGTITATRTGSGSGSAPARPKAGPARPQAAPRPSSGAAARPQAPRGGSRQPGLVRPTPKAKVRKARLLISKVDPWSVLKMSFLLSVALGIMTVVCAVMLWSVMDLTGIFDRVNDLLAQVLGTEGEGFAIEQMVTLGQIASFATIIAVINVVLLTVLAMLAAILYNISASLVGGIGVTLTDD
ncbi:MULTISPECIES: DUF3566 domain-containing protein [Actinomycetes]|uniref:DUF3566 domain-containing protein n=3 Tax=Actinomycetes TaxID=1760 RepID=A0ABP6LSA3_9MICC|nr:DUF3566 domain-containing protein [Nesterenkonia sp. CL21]MDS2173400.1 DUF3566 domain-containing protein [Nesterenkonia sp. CL21]